MEMCENISRWNLLRQNVYNACQSLKTHDKIKNQDIASFKELLREQYKNSTRVEIAMRERLIKTNERIRHMLKNRNNLEKISENYFMSQEIKANYQKNYPKSGNIRRALIENDRFKLNYVTPKLTSTFRKILIKLQSLL